MKKHKEPKVTAMHQHKDRWGKSFGKEHPLNVIHKKENTQEWHEYTLAGNFIYEANNVLEG